MGAQGPCLEDPALVHLSVPTTITGGGDALWDLGFLRRRVIVSQNVTLDSLRLRVRCRHHGQRLLNIPHTQEALPWTRQSMSCAELAAATPPVVAEPGEGLGTAPCMPGEQVGAPMSNQESEDTVC